MTAFDTAWDLVKAELPDLDLGGKYQIHSTPRFGMHSDPGASLSAFCLSSAGTASVGACREAVSD